MVIELNHVVWELWETPLRHLSPKSDDFSSKRDMNPGVSIWGTQHSTCSACIKATMMSIATASFFPYLALAMRWTQHSFCDHVGTYLEILKVFRHRWPEVCRKPVLAGNTKGVESSVQ